MAEGDLSVGVTGPESPLLGPRVGVSRPGGWGAGAEMGLAGAQ